MNPASKSQDLKKAARGSGTNYLTALFQIGIFVFHTLGARLLGKLAYGAYIFSWSIIEIANKITLAGLDKGLIRAVASERARGDEKAEHNALATALRVVLLVSMVVVVVLESGAGWLSAWQGAPEYAGTLRLMGPVTFLWSGTVVLIAATMGLRTMRYNLLVRGIADPLLLILSILAWALCWRDGGGPAMALAHLSAACGTFLLALLAFGKCFNLKKLSAGLWRERLDRRLVRFSVPVGLAELLNQAIYRVDVILIGAYMQDPLQVANYGACILLASTISSVRYAFDPVLSPVVAECMVSGDRERLKHNLRLMVRWVTLLALPVFLVMALFGEPLLSLWGESFTDAYPALVLLCLSHMSNAVLGLHQWPVVMSGRSMLDLLNNCLAFALNLSLNFLLIPRHGLVGAGAANLAGNLLLRVLQTIEVGLLFELHAFSRAFLKVLVAAVPLAAGMLLPRWMGMKGAGAMAVGLVAGLIAYLACYSALGLAEEEKKLLSTLRRKRQKAQE